MRRLRKFAALAAVCNIASIVLISIGLGTGQWISCDIKQVRAGLANERGGLSFTLFKVTYTVDDLTGSATGKRAE